MDDAYAEMSVLIQECQRDAFSLDASFQVCIFPRESPSTGRSENQTILVFYFLKDGRSKRRQLTMFDNYFARRKVRIFELLRLN